MRPLFFWILVAASGALYVFTWAYYLEASA